MVQCEQWRALVRPHGVARKLTACGLGKLWTLIMWRVKVFLRMNCSVHIEHWRQERKRVIVAVQHCSVIRAAPFFSPCAAFVRCARRGAVEAPPSRWTWTCTACTCTSDGSNSARWCVTSPDTQLSVIWRSVTPVADLLTCTLTQPLVSCTNRFSFLK